MGTRDLATNELAKTNWRGTALPLRSQAGGHYAPKSIRALLKSSIYMILTTPIGSRPFRPTFGSLIPSLVFEPDDTMLVSMMHTYSIEAIEKWENRIRILGVKVEIEVQSNTLAIEIKYTILATNEDVQDKITLPRGSALEVLR